MITAEVIQQTESRYVQRQPIRQEREAKIRAGAILQADTPERVTERLRQISRAIVATEGIRPPAPGQPSGPAVQAIERILNRNDLMSVRYLEIGVRVARSIGRIHVTSPDGSGFGTGFLVSPRLVLTNNHVLENASVAASSRIEFDFQEGPDGRLRSSVFVNFDPTAFFVTDRALDFSLVALRGDVRPLARFGFNGIASNEARVIAGEYVSIIQHPSGERKQLALRENQVVDVLDNFLHYKTDTAPGSSGSPVFNDQWEIVALHHSGVPRKDASGRILTRDGRVWNASMGDDAIHWIANEGVRISKIVQHVRALSLSESQATLRQQFLNAERGWRGDLTARELAAEFGDESAAGIGTTASRLPLTLTIDIGQAPSGMTVSAAATPPRAASETSAPTPMAAGWSSEPETGLPAAAPAQDELAAWRSRESALRAAASPGVPPVGSTPLEWLTGAPATETGDQFASPNVADQFVAKATFAGAM